MFRVIPLAALLVFLAAAVARADEPPILGGTTTISGDHSGYIEVTLPHMVTAPDRQNTITVDIAGEGDLRGAGLVSTAMDGPRRAVELVWLAHHGDPRPGDDYSATQTIEPGVYRLYLFASAPATATFSFRGLDGTASFSPTTATRVDMAAYTTRAAPPDYSAAAAVVRFPGYGPYYSWRTWDFGSGRRGSIESCWYTTADAANREDAYGPGCGDPDDPFQVLRPIQFADTTGVESGIAGWFGAGTTIGAGLNGKTHDGPPPVIRGFAAAISLDLPPDAPPTAAEQPGSVPSPSGAQPVVSPRAQPTARTFRATAHRALIRLLCPSGDECLGWASVGGGRVNYRIAPGTARIVRLPLTQRQSRRLARRHVLRLQLAIASGDVVRRSGVTVRTH